MAASSVLYFFFPSFFEGGLVWWWLELGDDKMNAMYFAMYVFFFNTQTDFLLEALISFGKELCVGRLEGVIFHGVEEVALSLTRRPE